MFVLSQQNKERYWPKVVHVIAGAGAGFFAAIATCPLDVVKTVLQVQNKSINSHKKYDGIFGTFRTIFREEGMRGLYKGLGPTITALVPNWAIYFFTYQQFKETLLANKFSDGPFVHMTSAIGGATITDICMNPLWFIKTRLQTQKIHGNVQYRSAFHAVSTIFREEGPKAFFSGLTPQLIGVVHVAIQFPLYEHLKFQFANAGEKRNDQLSTFELGTSAGISKIIASVAAYPHEVLRAKLMYQHVNDPNRYKGVFDACRRIYLEEGILGFYKGMGANLLRVTPSCIISFTTYELLVRIIK